MFKEMLLTTVSHAGWGYRLRPKLLGISYDKKHPQYVWAMN